MFQGFAQIIQDFGRIVQQFLVESSGRIAFWSNRLVIITKHLLKTGANLGFFTKGGGAAGLKFVAKNHNFMTFLEELEN